MVYGPFPSASMIMGFWYLGSGMRFRRPGAHRMMGEGKVERSECRIVAIDRTHTSGTDGLAGTSGGFRFPSSQQRAGSGSGKSPIPRCCVRKIDPSLLHLALASAVSPLLAILWFGPCGAFFR